jgi:hypothetical protein
VLSNGVLPERIKNETAKAYQALLDYCLMGAVRSLPKLHQIYTENAQVQPVTRHLRTLKGWSTRHHWQDRVAQYEKRLAEQREKHKEQKRIEIEQQATADHDRMLVIWDGRFALVEEVPNAAKSGELYGLIKLRREIDDFGRRSVGLPDKVTESTLKGPGKDGAIVISDERAEYHSRALATLAESLGNLLVERREERDRAMDAAERPTVDGSTEPS